VCSNIYIHALDIENKECRQALLIIFIGILCILILHSYCIKFSFIQLKFTVLELPKVNKNFIYLVSDVMQGLEFNTLFDCKICLVMYEAFINICFSPYMF